MSKVEGVYRSVTLNDTNFVIFVRESDGWSRLTYNYFHRNVDNIR